MKTFEELHRYVGHDFQTFGTREARITGGREDNVRVVEVKNGAGLEFTVVPDRAMDIANLTYKGINCAFMAKNGIVNPQYFVEKGKECFYRNFFGGMLYTCGLTYMGASCEDEGRELGLHGPISFIAAEGLSARVEDRETNSPVIVLKGTMRQTEVYKEYLILDREIKVNYGDNKIYLRDKIINKGYDKQPLMMLYHWNFGYPFLSEHTKLILPQKELEPRDEIARKGVENRFNMEKPEDNRIEECFFYRLNSEADGRTAGMVINKEIPFAMVLRFNAQQLEYTTEWKSMMAGDYALGINPGTYTPMGRAHARAHNKLLFIEPGEIKNFDFILEIIEDKEKIIEAQKYIENL